MNKKTALLRRFGAFLVDHILICTIAMLPFMIKFNDLSEDDISLFSIYTIAMAIGVICYLLKDVFGRSLGKLMFGLYIREYPDTNQVPKFYQLILRNIFIFVWFIEFFVMLIDKNGQRIGDKVSKTQVVGYQGRIVLRVISTCIITFILFGVFIFCGVTQVIKSNESYKSAVQYIKQQERISSEIGEIMGFGYFPIGGVNYTNGYGTADFYIEVKGSKKTIDVNVNLSKNPNSNWVVDNINY